MKLFSYFHLSPNEALPSLGAIRRGIMKLGVAIGVFQACIFIEQYFYAVLMILVALIFLPIVWYVFFKATWFRQWIALVAAINGAAVSLMFATGSLWWVFAAFFFEIFIHFLFFEEKLFYFCRINKIPTDD